MQGVYIDLGKTDLTSDKIKLYVRKNLTAAFVISLVNSRERLIHVLFLMMADVSSGVPELILLNYVKLVQVSQSNFPDLITR